MLQSAEGNATRRIQGCETFGSKERAAKRLNKKVRTNTCCHQKKIKCLSLKELAFKKVKTLPKALLASIYAEITYSTVEKSCRASFPYSQDSCIDGDIISWFSYPMTRVSLSGQHLPLFGVCDSHHILTNLRSKVCSSGIRESGLQRDAWVKVA